MSDFESPQGLVYLRTTPENEGCEMPGRPWLRALDSTTETVYFYRPNCGSWSCPYCSGRNKARWTWLIGYGASVLLESKTELHFTTLTNHERLGPQATLELFPEQWKRLSGRAKYAAGRGQYVLIPERHESGRLHVHMLDTFALPRKWWKDNSRAVGMGYMADSSIARSAAGAGYYASKYIGKQLGIPWPKGFRRVRLSRGYPRPEDDTQECPFDWSKLPMGTDVFQQMEKWERAGYNVKVLSPSDWEGLLNTVQMENQE